MTLTNAQIYNLVEVLNKIQQQDNKFPIKIGFYILQNIKELNNVYESINQMRQQVILKYGQPQDNGQISLSEEALKSANEELDELGQITSEVNLKQLDIEDIEFLSLSLLDIQKLSPILKGEG